MLLNYQIANHLAINYFIDEDTLYAAGAILIILNLLTYKADINLNDKNTLSINQAFKGALLFPEDHLSFDIYPAFVSSNQCFFIALR